MCLLCIELFVMGLSEITKWTEKETSDAKIAERKLQENVRKLQDINQKTTDMQDTAKSFSSLAKQMLQTEQGRRSSIPPGISRPDFGIGTEAKIGIFDSRTLRTSGKKDELDNDNYIAIMNPITDLSSSNCIEKERQALLDLKKGFVDDDNLLSSWTTWEPHKVAIS
ncbi:hypothetical protein F8388_022531 [Cannabis sativa]|uniref:Leucine-rich repeat-containing N-terminal plant-type domain-containing protein n=1 Tax=Cannabis sativa TaxID=3483 RepID=A0A7J6EK72_CANSA|nr:hypothetical protein F8388_022531 [Cannabis sativa]